MRVDRGSYFFNSLKQLFLNNLEIKEPYQIKKSFERKMLLEAFSNNAIAKLIITIHTVEVNRNSLEQKIC